LELQRRAVERVIGSDRISWIHADATLAVCQQRDVKGLYAQAAAGTMTQMTGVGSAFERPERCDCVIPTGSEPVQASAERLREFALSVLRAASRSRG
jgi:adenylylsulfate kinase-like enzyme